MQLPTILLSHTSEQSIHTSIVRNHQQAFPHLNIVLASTHTQREGGERREGGRRGKEGGRRGREGCRGREGGEGGRGVEGGREGGKEGEEERETHTHHEHRVVPKLVLVYSPD